MRTEAKQYTVAETAKLCGISIGTLGILRRNGLIPRPQKHGRKHLHGEDVIAKIPAILAERRLNGTKAHSRSMVRRWQDPTQRDELRFNMSKPRNRKRTKFSPEFLAHQGRLKDPRKHASAKAGHQEFLRDTDKVEHWREALTVAANRPEVRAAKSESMKRRAAEKKAELERLRAKANQVIAEDVGQKLAQPTKYIWLSLEETIEALGISRATFFKNLPTYKRLREGKKGFYTTASVIEQLKQ